MMARVWYLIYEVKNCNNEEYGTYIANICRFNPGDISNIAYLQGQKSGGWPWQSQQQTWQKKLGKQTMKHTSNISPIKLPLFY